MNVRCLEHQGHEWLELQISVVPFDKIRPSAMLAYNFNLVIGQLSRLYDRIVLTQTLPLENIEPENIDEVAEFFAAEAARASSAIAVTVPGLITGDY